jgi:hypothetical protein
MAHTLYIFHRRKRCNRSINTFLQMSSKVLSKRFRQKRPIFGQMLPDSLDNSFLTWKALGTIAHRHLKVSDVQVQAVAALLNVEVQSMKSIAVVLLYLCHTVLTNNMNDFSLGGNGLFNSSHPPQSQAQPPLLYNSNFQVEMLDLPDLMKNHHVQLMYKNWQDASNQIVQAVQIQQKLYEENLRLQHQVEELKSLRWNNNR